MRTYIAKTGEIDRSWYVIDAEGQTLGRIATRIADALRGKNKPIYTPHVDTGDFVIVLNASKVHLTGRKLDQKNYYKHSTYPGGLKVLDARTVRETDPERMFQHAIKGMLPKNKLSRDILKKLKVYPGTAHPHAGQKPQPLP